VREKALKELAAQRRRKVHGGHRVELWLVPQHQRGGGCWLAGGGAGAELASLKPSQASTSSAAWLGRMVRLRTLRSRGGRRELTVV